MVGPPIDFYSSDTYHMSTLIGTYEYVLHSADLTWFNALWPKISFGIQFIQLKLDSTGLFDCTGTADWGRYTQGGHNTEANALAYRTLIVGSIMAGWAGDSSLASTLTSQAAALKTAVNSANWDASVGHVNLKKYTSKLLIVNRAFKDSDTDASVIPEDGNSLALYYDMASSSNFNSISNQLTTNWGPYGANCPEMTDNIVPYVESMEVKGHLGVGQATRALQLMRLSWGWYLNNPYGTGSTLPEGYLQDGTFGYRANAGYANDYSYMSHSHGWSTGPTHALSWYVVGIQLNNPGGGEWTLAPQFGDLTSAQGGYTTGNGSFSSGWTLQTGGYTVWYAMPPGTTGTLLFPGQNPVTVVIDGALISKRSLEVSNGVVTIKDQPGGNHTIVVTTS